ncbi:hypothetical protein CF326_g8659, partial [Tilletia indica]
MACLSLVSTAPPSNSTVTFSPRSYRPALITLIMLCYTRSRSRGVAAATTLAAVVAAFICLGSAARAAPVTVENFAGELNVNATLHSSGVISQLPSSHHHTFTAPQTEMTNDVGQKNVTKNMTSSIQSLPARHLRANQT